MGIKEEVISSLRAEGIEVTKIGDHEELTAITTEGKEELDSFARQQQIDYVLAREFLSSDHARSLLGFDEEIVEEEC